MNKPAEVKIDIDQQIITVTTQTVDLLFSKIEYQDAMVLYFFYIKTAKWQGNSVIWANGDYCMKSLHWGDVRYFEAKKNLKELKLLEDVVKKNEKNGRMEKHYIKVKFVWKPTTSTSEVLDEELASKPTTSTLEVLDQKSTTSENHTLAVVEHIPDVTKNIPDETKEHKKKKTNYAEEASIVLEHWNEQYKTRYKAPKAIVNNLTYWRDSYSLEDILLAIDNIRYDDYWKDIMTPVMLLRRKNPQGEEVDYISNFLQHESFYTPEEQKEVDEAKERMKKMGLA